MFGSICARSFLGKDLCHAYSLSRFLSVELNPLFEWNSKITSSFRKGDVSNARKLFDEMPQKNLVTWNCMVSGYSRNGMISEARDVFDSMPVKDVVSWTAMLTGYAKIGRLEEARVLFDAVEEKNVVCWNAMVSGYLSCGRIGEGRAIFDMMPVRNDVSWTTIIEGYFRCGDVGEAERLFYGAPNRSVLMCNAMLAGYRDMMCIDKSYDLFMKMAIRDVVSWTSMLSCFIRAGEVESAKNVFEEMPQKDVVAWTVMIQGYLDNGSFALARDLFEQMPNKDILAWNTIFSGYVQYGNIEDSIEFFMRIPYRNVISWNLMLRAYLQEGNVSRAREFFYEIPRRDITSWNTMISGYQSEEGLKLFVQMLSIGFRPNQSTLTSIITISGILPEHHWGKAMHSFVVKTGFETDDMVMSSLISMYSRCGFIADASYVFKTKQNHDSVVWNAMLVAQAHHRSAKAAFIFFHRMTCTGCQPDHVTFLILLNACAHSGLVSEGWKYFQLMGRWNLVPKPEHCACMVDLLGRSGLLSEALELVNQLPVRIPAYAWESLLSACRIHEKYELSDLIVEKILNYESCDIDMCVLQSNIYSARGMWNEAADVRAKIKRQQVKKDLGCSWIA